MEAGRKGEGDKVGGKIGSLPSDLYTSASQPCTLLERAEFFLYPVGLLAWAWGLPLPPWEDGVESKLAHGCGM